ATGPAPPPPGAACPGASGAAHSWRSSSQIPPTLLATMTAATVAAPAGTLATPTPPGRGGPPPALATVAPVPAPTAPTAGCPVAAGHQHARAAGAARLIGPVPDRHAAGQPGRGLGVVRRHICLLALAAGYAGTAAAPGQ